MVRSRHNRYEYDSTYVLRITVKEVYVRYVTYKNPTRANRYNSHNVYGISPVVAVFPFAPPFFFFVSSTIPAFLSFWNLCLRIVFRRWISVELFRRLFPPLFLSHVNIREKRLDRLFQVPRRKYEIVSSVIRSLPVYVLTQNSCVSHQPNGIDRLIRGYTLEYSTAFNY